MTARHTVIYDGECRLCRRSVDVLARWDPDGRLELVPFQDAEVRERFPSLSLDALGTALHLVRPDGSVATGARAIEELLTMLRPTRWLAGATAIPGVRFFAERLYRVIARRRLHLGDVACDAHCRGRSPSTRR